MLSPNDMARAGPAFDGIFDSIKSGLASVLPAHTIVGKWAQGDTAGAVAAAEKALSPKAPQAISVPSAGSGPQGAAPEEDNTMLYVGIGAVALIGLLLVMRRQ